ncbi:hypothetical protein ACFY00_30640 [Kitasatospora sp. NPDC001540]|uniref:hypothetical protein n=1 Tax=Kitasatospora sp. NPDC001540 TaxID=3364014 RepID=UPI0036B0CC71
MFQRLLRFLPDGLVSPLGYRPVYGPADLAAALAANYDAAHAAQNAESRIARRRLTSPLMFQVGLLDLHREAADIVVFLRADLAAAESNLDLDDPAQRTLHQALLDALQAAEDLRLHVATAAARSLPAESSTVPQHS